MNIIYLIFARIRYYFTKSRTIFILFLAGGVLNTILVTYCYGNLLPAIANRNSTDMNRRVYTVVFGGQFAMDPNETADSNALKTLLSSPLIQGCIVKTADKVGTVYGDYPLTKINGSLDFNEKNGVIVPAMEKATLDDKIMVGPTILPVIGTASNTNGTYLISNTDFEALELQNAVRTVYVLASTDRQATPDNIMQLLHTIFPTAAGSGGDAYMLSAVDKQGSELYSVLIALAGLIAIISQAFLFGNLLRKARKYNVIQSIVGYSKLQIAEQTFAEAFFLVFVPTATGILIHLLGYGLFQKLNVNPDITYFASDYFIIFAFMILLSMVILGPTALLSAFLTPVQNRKHLSE